MIQSASSLTVPPLLRVVFIYYLSDLIPYDLIGLQMQGKAASIAFIHYGILGFIRIVDHAVFSVFHIRMDFHIIILGKPLVQVLLIVG